MVVDETLGRWIPNFWPVFQDRSDMSQMKNFTSKGIFYIIASVTDQAQNADSFANHLINMHFPIQIISEHDANIILTSNRKVNCGYRVYNQQEQYGDILSFDLKHHTFFCIKINTPVIKSNEVILQSHLIINGRNCSI